jgi:hypothetical protein
MTEPDSSIPPSLESFLELQAVLYLYRIIRDFGGYSETFLTDHADYARVIKTPISLKSISGRWIEQRYDEGLLSFHADLCLFLHTYSLYHRSFAEFSQRAIDLPMS